MHLQTFQKRRDKGQPLKRTHPAMLANYYCTKKVQTRTTYDRIRDANYKNSYCEHFMKRRGRSRPSPTEYVTPILRTLTAQRKYSPDSDKDVISMTWQPSCRISHNWAHVRMHRQLLKTVTRAWQNMYKNSMWLQVCTNAAPATKDSHRIYFSLVRRVVESLRNIMVSHDTK